MRFVAEPAFVLHARPWRETSLLVEVLSAEFGRVGLVARGVQGVKKHVLRAALQPLQSIRFDAVQKGELAQLQGAEAIDAAPLLQGDAALASFYINELCLRLAPRQVPQPELYAAYAQVRERLRTGALLAWTLRRFERDLLDALGVGLEFAQEGEGDAIDPAARYRLDPEYGPRRLLSTRDGDYRSAATGRALLALADDVLPQSDDLSSLRLPMRHVLLHHLGGRGLKSWEMLGELGRLTAAPAPET
ncbi:MAG: DNA repair protein RecO [Thermomonas sp.]|jgi:DNA repair protein RecO (recombination protein O)|uniref:DNA repair protein RecO n=1 Tax=Thermomonas sp. TaxID=1971895 RepID=UPI001ED79195|nr:DNA repair protein RecO [Thermomonas sp.]MBV2208921.1 DNA repair protein RecO [Thermomonas sp.]